MISQERLLTLLRSPHVSEKSVGLADKYRQIVFKVFKNATKAEIKQAVETLFKVKVQSVTVVNIRGKKKHFKQRIGCRKGFKKAYVRLQEGYDLDFTSLAKS